MVSLHAMQVSGESAKKWLTGEKVGVGAPQGLYRVPELLNLGISSLFIIKVGIVLHFMGIVFIQS